MIKHTQASFKEVRLTLATSVEQVVVHVVVATSQADADSVFDVHNCVIEYISVERLQDSDTGVLNVVYIVSCQCNGFIGGVGL